MVERCKKKCITYGFHFYFVSSLFLKYEIYSEKYTSQSVQLVNFHKVNTAEYVPLRARKGTVPSSTKPFQTLYPLLPDVIFTSNTIDCSSLLGICINEVIYYVVFCIWHFCLTSCLGNPYTLLGVVVIYWFSLLLFHYMNSIISVSSLLFHGWWVFVLFFSLAFGCYSCYRFCQGHSSAWFFGAYFRISFGYISVHGIVESCAYLPLVDTFDFPSDHNNLHSRWQFMRILVALPQHFGVSFWISEVVSFYHGFIFCFPYVWSWTPLKIFIGKYT